jgi:hypothetical protein
LNDAADEPEVGEPGDQHGGDDGCAYDLRDATLRDRGGLGHDAVALKRRARCDQRDNQRLIA